MKRAKSAISVTILTLGLIVVAPLTPAHAGVTQFDVYMAGERAATGTPLPTSMTEVVLPKTGSYATTTVNGSGRIVVGATGANCDGWPILAVAGDGTAGGTVHLTSTTKYGAYMTSAWFSGGTHMVKVTLTNDFYAPGRCDRNAYLASVRMEFPPTSLTSAPVRPGKPSAATTGVPEGTALKVHSGDLSVTQAGAVIDGFDVRGAIYVKANNVTIKRSIVRGGPANSKNMALIASWWGNTNIKIEDSTLRADYPSYWLDGISGANISISRLDISRVVDGVKVIGGNVSVADSWIHANAHFQPDPNQSDGKTHDDGVQVTGGKNVTIVGNNIENAYNSSIMVGQGKTTGNITIAGNWLSDGGCALNVTQAGTGTPILGMTVSGNRFGLGRYSTSCPMRLPAASPITLSGNVWDSTGQPAVPQRF